VLLATAGHDAHAGAQVGVRLCHAAQRRGMPAGSLRAVDVVAAVVDDVPLERRLRIERHVSVVTDG